MAQHIALTGEYMTLAQCLKKMALVQSGGETKHFLCTVAITVNGQSEQRRGRKLRVGDLLCIAGYGEYVIV